MKKLIVSLLLASVLVFAFAFAACGDGHVDVDDTTYTVIFNYNYTGSSNDTVQVKSGDTVAKPTDPSREGYVFDDWYTDRNCTEGNEYVFSTPVTQNLVLYAGWLSTSATVTFNYNYVGAPAVSTQTVDLGGNAVAPVDPVRDRYEFTGWYTDAACTDSNKFDFNTAISADITLYAGWMQTLIEVTYNLNYTGAQEMEAFYIDAGNSFAKPETDPEREGYDFSGWYTDASCTASYDFESVPTGDIILYAGWTVTVLTVTFNTNYDGLTVESQSVEYGGTASEPTVERSGYICIWQLDGSETEYDFSTPVTQDITLEASWESESSDYYTVTFYYNYDGAPSDVYDCQEVVWGDRAIKPSSPQRDGYYFVGWYTDAACTEEFSFNTRIKSSMDVYAKWFTDYVFEAEYTDLDGKAGMGWSANVSGTAMIVKYEGAHNGYYVSYLYYNGAFLEFDITSETEVDDAIIILTIGAEYYAMTFSPDNVKVYLNDEELSYSAISITDVSGAGSTYRDFYNVVLTDPAHLVAGENKIKIEVCNSTYYSGTMMATAPIVDCIHVCTDAVLSWNPKTSNVA
ncbi:MAG: InlB B-repeat-containing protein [Clostridia bacterium]|nr:InlB B-repeat-containing protein [Clostridia bacterium]